MSTATPEPTNYLMTRLTPQEREAIHQTARQSGLSTQMYTRCLMRLAIGETPGEINTLPLEQRRAMEAAVKEVRKLAEKARKEELRRIDKERTALIAAETKRRTKALDKVARAMQTHAEKPTTYNEDQMYKAAYEAHEAGVSWTDLSAMLNKPLSSLHRRARAAGKK